MKLRRMVDADDSLLGYIFHCPGCKSGHAVWTTKPNSLGAQWTFDGNMERPTFSPSVLAKWKSRDGKEKICHSFVRDGHIQFLSDCTHELAGQTVPLPDDEGVGG
jgi:hypothetical protein